MNPKDVREGIFFLMKNMTQKSQNRNNKFVTYEKVRKIGYLQGK